MPIINFYASQDDYVKYAGMDEKKKLEIKEKVREHFKKLIG